MDYVNQDHKDFVEELNKTVRENLCPKNGAEGNIYWAEIDDHIKSPDDHTNETWDNFIEKRQLIHKLASEKHVSDVLEIGFNAGHSTSLWLFSDPDIRVRAIDICNWVYTRKCAEFIKERFPNRFDFFAGDSTVVFPEQNEHFVNCDLVHVDGCHLTEVCRTDIMNSFQLPHNTNRKVLLDDADAPEIAPLLHDLLEQSVVKVWTLPGFKYRKYHTVLTSIGEN